MYACCTLLALHLHQTIVIIIIIISVYPTVTIITQCDSVVLRVIIIKPNKSNNDQTQGSKKKKNRSFRNY